MGNTTDIDVSIALFGLQPDGGLDAALEALLCSADFGTGRTQRFLPITELKDTERPDEGAARCLKAFTGLEGVNLMQACTERSATGGLIITYAGILPEGAVMDIPKGAAMCRIKMENKKTVYYSSGAPVPEDGIAFDTRFSMLTALKTLIAAAYDPETAGLGPRQAGLLRTALFG